MDFDLAPDDDSRRLEVRAWCRSHPAPTGEQLARSGYMAPHWPPPYGVGADTEMVLIVEEELQRAGIRRPANSVVVTHNCGPIVLRHGTPEFREAHLWPALAGEETWCQAYSEPGAGSDMSNSQTQARRDGDCYVVNGSKIWTSNAHVADFAFALVRTDPSAPKHRGLSILMIDLGAPGVEVRPIYNMTGRPAEFNEVFFTDVRVPMTARVGDEGGGWVLAVSQMSSERVLTATPRDQGSSARSLLDGLAAVGGLDDPAVRDQAAANYIEGEALRLLACRDLSERIQGRDAGPEGSVMRLLSGPHIQRTAAIALESMGLRGLVNDAEPFGPAPGDLELLATSWPEVMWIAPMFTIAAGTAEVQKNIIAERLLGFPRDPDPDAKLPWNETRSRRATA